MNGWIRLILIFLGQQAKLRLIFEAKRRGVAAYLRAVQTTRQVLLAVLLGFVFLQMMMMAGFGALVTGFMLWDHDYAAKIEILFFVFLGLFTLPALGLFVLFSERLWFRLSGGQRLMDEVRHQERDAA